MSNRLFKNILFKEQKSNYLMNNNELYITFFQAKIQKFDKNFFNFEDPEVYRKFVNPNETDIWKKTYGYDYACTHKLPNEEDNSDLVRSANSFRCNR